MDRRRPINAKILKLGLSHIVLISLGILFALPLLWVICTALKPISETTSSPPTWLPSHFQWKNFAEAFSYNEKELGYKPFLVYGRNTVYLVILTVVGTLASNSVVAYAFARMKWKGRDVLFQLTLATMMVPGPALMVPLYALFHRLGWVGTFRPLWVPAFFGSAFNIFLLRQFFMSIPMDLSDAAKIDGASEWRTFTDVILPLAKPALTVVGVFTFMGTWNDFLGPLLYLTDQRTFTLSLGLQFFQSQHTGTPWNLLMAASCIVLLPVIVVFFLAQKVFTQGISTTGLK